MVVRGISELWLPPAATAYADKDGTLLPPPPPDALTGVVLTCDRFPTAGWVGVRLREFDLFGGPGVFEMLPELPLELLEED